MKTSARELKDITKAWIAISIAFSVLLTKELFSLEFVINFLISGLTVGLGFLLHEMGHKIMAQKYGCFAEFRSFDIMLVLAVIMSFFGFIFAAPGAVMISGHVNAERNGKISLLGPLTNFILAILFLSLGGINMEIIKMISYYGFFINSILGLFNLIPFWQFDGNKIYHWSKGVWFLMVIFGISIMMLQS
ncbi:hypothetical protein J4427_00435 [Candidatus Woesearchaeota archaeon]|nr:hypothetical protein [Candidatus Woesearchaeota archaeon]